MFGFWTPLFTSPADEINRNNGSPENVFLLFCTGDRFEYSSVLAPSSDALCYVRSFLFLDVPSSKARSYVRSVL